MAIDNIKSFSLATLSNWKDRNALMHWKIEHGLTSKNPKSKIEVSLVNKFHLSRYSMLDPGIGNPEILWIWNSAWTLERLGNPFENKVLWKRYISYKSLDSTIRSHTSISVSDWYHSFHK